MGAKVEGLTVKSAADRLALIFPDYESGYFARQLRNWSEKGIIKPIGRQSNARNAANIYDVQVIYKAAILSQMTSIGIGGSVLGDISTAMEENNISCLNESEERNERVLDYLVSGNGEIFLIIAIDAIPNVAELMFADRDYTSAVAPGFSYHTIVTGASRIAALVRDVEKRKGVPPMSSGIPSER